MDSRETIGDMNPLNSNLVDDVFTGEQIKPDDESKEKLKNEKYQNNLGATTAEALLKSEHPDIQRGEVANVAEQSNQMNLQQETHLINEFEQSEDNINLDAPENDNEQDDQMLLVPHPGDEEDSDYMVTSLDTSSGSENSLNMADVSIITTDDVYTPPSPSQDSMNSSMESLPYGDISGSYVIPNISQEGSFRSTPESSFHEVRGPASESSFHEEPSSTSESSPHGERGIETNITSPSDDDSRLQIPSLEDRGDENIIISSPDDESQILAPLNLSDEVEDEGVERIHLTPILSRSLSVDEPSSPTISSISNNSGQTPLLHPNISDILFGHPQINTVHFQRQNLSTRGMTLAIIHQHILVPFIHGFSWAFGIHIYRYLRYGFSMRGLFRSLFAGITGRNTSSA